MTRRIRLTLVCVACVAGSLTWWGVSASTGTEPETEAAGTCPKTVELQPVADEEEDLDSKVATFMRKKLTASQMVLEGLVTEDYDMIEKGAKSMEAMSRASDWQMIKGPIYKQFSSEFRKTSEDLAKAAKDENVDAAGLAYMRLTMGCITCHNFVRSTMMADAPAGPGFALHAK